jgi:GlpG protein
MLELTHCAHEASAAALADHLLAHGIDTSIRGQGPWELWILDHDQLEAARGLLAKWHASGTTDADRRGAATIRRERRHDHEAVEQRAIDPRRRWYAAPTRGLGPVTLFLAIAAVLVGMASNFGDPTTMTIQNLSIEPWTTGQFLGRVREGEAWRLLTPMLIHFGVLHLAFNLMWLWRLGRQIEHEHGSLVMLVVVVLAEVPGSLGQYWISGPNFGGLSGVVYGAFGFVWMHARYDRRRSYALRDKDSLLVMLWFVACATGAFGPIANVGHAGGLLAGLLLGLPPYVRHLRAHVQAPMFVGNDWASVHLTGPRRIYRRFVSPYVPLWFVLLAAAVIWAE